MPPIPYRVSVRNHPGSTTHEIKNEPDWGSGHQHRVGFKNDQNRIPGLTHSGDEREEESDFTEDAIDKYQQLRNEVSEGKLVNFRDIITGQEDLHLRRPEVHSEGWRFVLNAREDWIKNEEQWPANLERKQKEEEARRKQGSEPKENELANGEEKDADEQGEVQQEHEWKRENGENKHHDAYGGAGSDADSEPPSDEEGKKSEYEKLREKYAPQEIALLRSIQHEKDYIYNLKQNDGKMKSPISHGHPLILIDEAD